MTSPVEYHSYVRHFFPASVVLLSWMILPAVFLASGHAQTNSTTGAVMPATGAVSPRTGGVAPPVGQLVSPPTGVPALSRIVLPDVGALALRARHSAWLTPDGEIDWESTIGFRDFLWDHGFGVADFDGAQMARSANPC